MVDLYILREKLLASVPQTLNAREMVRIQSSVKSWEKGGGGGGPHNHNIIYMRGQDYEGNHKRSLSQ